MDNDTQVKLGNVYNPAFTGMSFAGNVWSTNHVSPALNTMQGGGAATNDCRGER